VHHLVIQLEVLLAHQLEFEAGVSTRGATGVEGVPNTSCSSSPLKKAHCGGRLFSNPVGLEQPVV
jgi:hypothetical protein